ncbi:MAG: hypothetical protein ACKOOA_03010, partial [Sediminibacterium sp.]
NDTIIQEQMILLQHTLFEHHTNVSKGIKKAEQLAEKTHPVLSDQYWQQLNSGLSTEKESEHWLWTSSQFSK